MARARISLAKSGVAGSLAIGATGLAVSEQTPLTQHPPPPPAPALLALARLLARQAAHEARACDTEAS